jgi:hypothetical protein
MPIFTVIVKDNKSGNTKTVTVNTEGMVAAVVTGQTKEEHPQSQSQDPVVPSPPAEVPVEAPVVEVASGEEELPVKPENVHINVGGKRSAPSFRLKKRRVTRKFKKTR